MTCAVPNPIVFVDPHVTHLDGKEILDRRLPYAMGEDGLRDLKRSRLVGSIPDDLHTMMFNIREVELQVIESKKTTPFDRVCLPGCLKPSALGDS